MAKACPIGFRVHSAGMNMGDLFIRVAFPTADQRGKKHGGSWELVLVSLLDQISKFRVKDSESTFT